MKSVAFILDNHLPYAVSLKNDLTASNLFGEILILTSDQALLEMLKMASREYNRYLFLDYYLGDRPLNKIHRTFIEIYPNLKVIVMCSITNPVLIKNLLSFKPDGIIHKTDRTYDIIKCVLQISKGHKYYTRSIKEIIKTKKVGKIVFSPREVEMINFLARGYTTSQIGTALSISPNTVVSHKRKMFHKINCHTTDELLKYAAQKRIIE